MLELEPHAPAAGSGAAGTTAEAPVPAAVPELPEQRS
ncbi:MAG: hypothetical protein JWQ77_3102 [Jatrophihabitans sp.]|nr:hypothetical protein [Jatrophihabitans sp.]